MTAFSDQIRPLPRPLPKPRWRKTKKAKIHVGRPLNPREWKLPCKWMIVARRGDGDSFQRMDRITSAKNLEGLHEARDTAKELLERGWESVAILEVELLHPAKAK